MVRALSSEPQSWRELIELGWAPFLISSADFLQQAGPNGQITVFRITAGNGCSYDAGRSPCSAKYVIPRIADLHFDQGCSRDGHDLEQGVAGVGVASRALGIGSVRGLLDQAA
jgi:hypothetical protein